MMRLFFIFISCFCVVQAETVQCLGGKTTYGQHIAYAENNAWPVILRRLLGDKYSVSNSGEASGLSLDAPESDITVTVIEPEDCLDSTFDEPKVSAVIARLKQREGRKVIIFFGHFPTKGKSKSSRAFTALNKLCRNSGIHLVKVKADGFGQDPFGMERIAKKVHQYILGKWDTGEKLDAKLKKLALDFKVADFHGYKVYDVRSAGLNCRIIEPSQARSGKQWVMRKGFRTSFCQFDQAMLNEGYHVAVCNVAGLVGGPQAVRRWEELYKLGQKLGLHKKAVLEGLSRGGLLVYNYAYENPQTVAGIYADNPVCDFRSWPFKSDKNKAQQNQILKAYGILRNEVASYTGQANSMERLKPLVDAGIRVFHLQALDDDVVPAVDNGDVLERNYLALGGQINVIRKKGGHHPHSLTEPYPIVKFALECYGLSINYAALPQAAVEYRSSIKNWIGSMDNITKQINGSGDKLKVLMLGDSITWSMTGNGRRFSGTGKGVFHIRLKSFGALAAGICGDRTEHLLYRVQHGHLDKVNPSVVSIAIGVNNINAGRNTAQEIHEGTKALIAEIQKRKPRVKILLFGMFPTAKKDDPRRETYEKLQELNASLASENVKFVNMKKFFLNDDGSLNYERMKKDGIHITGKGYDVWTNVIAKELKELMK